MTDVKFNRLALQVLNVEVARSSRPTWGETAHPLLVSFPVHGYHKEDGVPWFLSQGVHFTLLLAHSVLLGSYGCPLPNVEIDAQVEVGDADERGEKLYSGGDHEEVPIVEELGMALFLREDALLGDVLPADDGWAVEEESGNPHHDHFDHCVSRHSLLSSVRHLEGKVGGRSMLLDSSQDACKA